MMRSELLAVFALFPFSVLGQESPHGTLHIRCTVCHSTDSWKMTKASAFQHAATGFPLTGKHESVPCASCHTGLKFSKATPECFACHTDVHKTELGTTCVRCHTTRSWKVTDMVQKHQATRFALLGRHASLACEACHANASQRQYAGTPIECVACHRTDYVQAASPNHTSAQFSTDCLQCHQPAARTWGSGFDHARTEFPLMGAHAATACSHCHAGNRFRGLETACIGCHRADYNAAANPAHAANGFSTECRFCHTQSAWRPATFDHSSTAFPLTGRHTSTACVACHTNNNYALTYQDCYQCHATQFDQAPNHVTSQFSHDCTPCHTTAAWRPSIFDHDGRSFRIYSGKHRGKWTSCAQCHPNAGQYQVFTCLSCHEHEQTRMDDKHRNKQGYIYSSPACYNCHRNV
jgi:hypothetical protein